MSNSTTAAPPTGVSMRRIAILGVVTTTATLIAAYLVGALLFYELRFKESAIRRKRGGQEKYGHLMRKSTIAAATFGMLTFLSQTFQIFLDLQNDVMFCDVLVKIDFTLTNFIFISVYALLWLRQRSIYVSASTRHLTTSCTRSLSVVTLVVMFAIAIINPAVFDATQWFKRTRFGCKLETSAFPDQYHWAALAITTLIFHAVLLALFVHPLVRHRAGMKSRSKIVSKKAQDIMQVIKRAFYLALVCVISDVIVVVVKVAVVTEIDVIPQIVADVNLLLNICCVIATFIDWRERVFPCIEIGSTTSSDMTSRRDDVTYSGTKLMTVSAREGQVEQTTVTSIHEN
nr:uncharacterized protein LOC100179835 [Ciona intestinalis]|eukprot:XP_002129498.1 uncharacterized protein LOC100179835 [Ciona intestinalis]